jgi:hypothetical protein
VPTRKRIQASSRKRMIIGATWLGKSTDVLLANTGDPELTTYATGRLWMTASVGCAKHDSLLAVNAKVFIIGLTFETGIKRQVRSKGMQG